MSICDSEENRKKLAWLVPGYILLAWFFCVLFQPLGLVSSSHRHLRDENGKRNYKVIQLGSPYTNETEWSSNITTDVCRNNGSLITLQAGADSALLISLENFHSHYSPFNCSLRIRSGETLDGLSAVIEELDLREHEDDVRAPGGHWGSSVCIDYVTVYTENSKVHSKLCGKWNLKEGNDRLSSEGNKQKLIGYCYDVQNGHSCEAKEIFINLVIDANLENSRRYAMKSHSRKSLSIVVTGYRHPTVKHNNEEQMSNDDICRNDEFTCYIHDGSIHNRKPHCIWNQLRCDSHANCGFHVNHDEKICSMSPLSPWSLSTNTLLLMLVWLAIVAILIFITLLLLRWHRALRLPFDGEQRRAIRLQEPQESSPSSRSGGTFSIMVMYRPGYPSSPKSLESQPLPPPTYESLFSNESPPPNYSLLTANGSDQIQEDNNSCIRLENILEDARQPL